MKILTFLFTILMILFSCARNDHEIKQLVGEISIDNSVHPGIYFIKIYNSGLKKLRLKNQFSELRLSNQVPYYVEIRAWNTNMNIIEIPDLMPDKGWYTPRIRDNEFEHQPNIDFNCGDIITHSFQIDRLFVGLDKNTIGKISNIQIKARIFYQEPGSDKKYWTDLMSKIIKYNQ